MERLTDIARLLGARGHIKGLTIDFSMLTLTAKGIDEIEGNKLQEPATPNVINISGGNFYSPAVGVNNSTNFLPQCSLRGCADRRVSKVPMADEKPI